MDYPTQPIPAGRAETVNEQALEDAHNARFHEGDALRAALAHCGVKTDAEGGAWFSEQALGKLAQLLAARR